MGGHTKSFDLWDLWILKLDQDGNVSWEKTYEGNNDNVFSIQQTTDGGYVAACKTYAFGIDGSDIWILKLDKDGNVSWSKIFGGSEFDFPRSIQQTSDGGYIVAGNLQLSGATADNDLFVLKLNSNGTIAWQKTFTGAQKIVLTASNRLQMEDILLLA